MKRLINYFAIIVVVMLVHSTAFSQVNSDYDKSVDFTKYKTFSFLGWQKESGKQLNDLDKQRLRDAFKSEFAQRDMTIVTDNADALVTLYLVVDDKTSTTAYTDYTGGLGMVRGVGWGMGVGGMGFGSSTTTYSEDDYKEGTFVMDIYDGTTKKLIWQATYGGIVQEKAAKRDKTIPKNVAKMMKKYPVAAKK